MYKTNKFKVFWWICGVGGYPRKSGHDIIETEIDFFDETEVEERIQEDLDACIPKLGGGTGAKGVFSWYHIPEADSENFKPNLPNFLTAHKEVINNNKHGSVSNWGIKKIVEVEQK